MNDKLRLRVTPIHYDRNTKFGFPNWQRLTESFDKSETEQVIRQKWVCNTPVFQLTEHPTSLHIEFTPNKIMNQPFGVHLSYDRFKECIQIVESELVKYGIDLKEPLTVAQIRRFDNSYDLLTSMEFYHYEPLIKTLTPHGIRKGRGRQVYTSYYYGNGNNDLVIYNKQVESNLDMPCVRVEYRHKNYAPKGQKIFLSDITEARYYREYSNDNAELLKCFFGFEPTITRARNIESLVAMLEQGVQVNIALKTIGINTIWNEALLHGINLNSLLKKDKKNPYYYRYNTLLNRLYECRPFEPLMIDRFNELKTLLRGAA